MTRVVVVALLAAAVVGIVALAAGGGSGPPHYTVVLDNAFGLSDGADVKIAGVRAGKVTGMSVDWATKRAKIGIRIDRQGFGALRADASCNSRPQSLIGEYFLDCDPGRSTALLRDGGTIPITRTSSTVAPDLIYAIQSYPVRERTRIVLDELGTGLAARGGALNAAIRRASPALREVDNVLAILASRRQELAGLTRDADTLLVALRNRRTDIGRFVRVAAAASTTVASRRDQLAAQLHNLPGFLDQLTPAMRDLGLVAQRQTPALQDLSAAAPDLERLLRISTQVATAGRPATLALGTAARTGRQAVKAATGDVNELARASVHAPEVATDGRFITDSLDSRTSAVEPDARSPGGKGFTPLKALVRLLYIASLGANFYDRYSYLSRGTTFVDNQCGRYLNATTVKNDPTLARCHSWLGPDQPAITAPDPSHKQAAAARSRRRHGARHRAAARPPAAAPPAPGAPGAPPARAPKLPVPLPQLPQLPAGPPSQVTNVLDYLLGP